MSSNSNASYRQKRFVLFLAVRPPYRSKRNKAEEVTPKGISWASNLQKPTEKVNRRTTKEQHEEGADVNNGLVQILGFDWDRRHLSTHYHRVIIFLVLLLIGCASSQIGNTDTAREIVEQCAVSSNYSIEYNGIMYRILWPNGDVASYQDTKEEAIEFRDALVWQAQLYLWKMDGKWGKVND